jgi:hypothetical protein
MSLFPSILGRWGIFVMNCPSNIERLPSRFFVRVTALILILSGIFAIFQGVTGRFLPHDECFLGMSARDLCALHGCRIVHFMIHDRVSFGGAVTATGLLYLWLGASPLQRGQAWAWWALLLSGSIGFASFLAYIGYGYLDSWHGLATLALLPCFLFGLTTPLRMRNRRDGILCLLQPILPLSCRSMAGLGRACLLATSIGLMVAGLTILVVGMTCVFVPQDLAYMGVRVEELHALNPRLVPLIAHDRAGFGGAVCSCGAALFACVWCGKPSRSLWCVLALVGAIGFGTAIGVHPAVGYNDVVHLAPALVGAIAYLMGLLLTFQRYLAGDK